MAAEHAFVSLVPRQGEYAPRGVLVELHEWEWEWARAVGIRRAEVRAASRDAHYYDPSRMEDNTRASIAAACAELGTAKLLNRHWGGHVWPVSEHARYAHLPDIPPNIEVRRVREPRNPVAVRRRDVEAGRYLVAVYAIPAGEFRCLDVLGGLPAAQAWEAGTVPSWDCRGTSRVVAQGLLVPARVPGTGLRD